MADQGPVARSPIAGRGGSGSPSAAVVLADETTLAKVLVRARADGSLARSLGVDGGRAARDGHGTLVARFGPDEWLLLAAPGVAPALVERVEGMPDDDLVSALDITSGRAVVRLSGPAAADVLAKVCAVDTARLPDGGAFRSFVAGVVAEVIRDDRPEPPGRSYLVACDRSYGQYLFDALADAAAEFGLRVPPKP
ncbi:MAG: sarcosine oxidase subunit gamma family protein [Acidimicrobiia bacterium]